MMIKKVGCVARIMGGKKENVNTFGKEIRI